MGTRFKEGHCYLVTFSDGCSGTIDGDEFVRSGQCLIYRIDGAEVYTAGDSARYVAELNGLIAEDIDGNILFSLTED